MSGKDPMRWDWDMILSIAEVRHALIDAITYYIQQKQEQSPVVYA